MLVSHTVKQDYLQRVIYTRDLIKVSDDDYKPKNRYERILRWLSQVDTILRDEFKSKAGLSDSELEKMAHILSS